MSKSVWVLTQSYNDYDQHGDYLVSVFLTQPTRQDLLICLFGGKGVNADYTKENHVFVSHLLTGGGRIKHEYSWYHLNTLIIGTIYQAAE